jgi:pimeloyl-ACP methyl ester carboxylesterase
MAMSGRLLTVNGHQIYTEEDQIGAPAVLLLHHGLGSTRSWSTQISSLEAAGWGVIAYDRRGYGKSEPRSQLSAPGFEDDLQDLHALLECLHLERVALVGHSDGGTIALYYAARYPERVTCLVTIAAHIYVEEKMVPSIEIIRQTFENDARFRDGLRRLHGEKTESVFWNWYSGWVKLENLSWNMRPNLSKVVCPVLVVQGEQDEHATPQHARDLAAGIANAGLWLVPSARHMLPQEDSERFNKRLLDFLAQVKEQEYEDVQ